MIAGDPPVTGNVRLDEFLRWTYNFNNTFTGNPVGGTGKILRSDGTTWAASTATYPNTVTANWLLYASATNVISDLATANNAFLVTSGTGVPSLGKTYLEGTYTPVVTLVGGAGNTVPQYLTVSGRYTQIGNLCINRVRLLNDGGNEGAGTGQINISLPITASASIQTLYQGAYLTNGANSYIGVTEVVASATTVALYYYSTITAVSTFKGALQNNTSRQIDFTLIYEV